MRIQIVLIAIVYCTSCTEYPVYPDVPQVEFYSATTRNNETDKIIDFSFMLYDGDGDVGLSQADTSAPFVDSLSKNLYAHVYAKKHGSFVKTPYTLSYRIPQLRPKGSTKFIKAKVSVELQFAKQLFPYDTIFLEYFVYDRALHKSNIDSSRQIIFY